MTDSGASSGLLEPGLVHQSLGGLEETAFFFQCKLVLLPSVATACDEFLQTVDILFGCLNLCRRQFGKAILQSRNSLAALLDLRRQRCQFLRVILPESQLFGFEEFFQYQVGFKESA